MPPLERKIRVLLVEDDPEDVRLIEECLKSLPVRHQLCVATDGAQAVDLLREESRALPDIILLDWNLPKKPGAQVLAEIKESPKSRHIPVLVLTTSSREEDVRSAYALHANCYVTKPLDWDNYKTAVELIQKFWFDLAALPGRVV